MRLNQCGNEIAAYLQPGQEPSAASAVSGGIMQEVVGLRDRSDQKFEDVLGMFWTRNKRRRLEVKAEKEGSTAAVK